MSERFIEHLVIGRFGNLIKGNTKKNEAIYVVILTLTSTLALHLTEANKTPTIIDHILVSFSDRVSEQDVKNVGLPDNQFIHCTRKNCRMKKKHKQFRCRSRKDYSANIYEEALGKLHFSNYQNFEKVDDGYSSY